MMIQFIYDVRKYEMGKNWEIERFQFEVFEGGGQIDRGYCLDIGWLIVIYFCRFEVSFCKILFYNVESVVVCVVLLLWIFLLIGFCLNWYI